MALVDYSNGPDDEPHEIVTASPVSLVAAEINQQISTAKAYPRSIERFRRAAITQATLTEDIARSCKYALPRGGKTIEGPSIRMAEIIYSAWGNCRWGSRVVAELDNFIVAQGVFMDLENNSALTVEVQRRILDKHGRRFDVDMIGITGRAACAIARRDVIIQAVPKAFWWDAYLAACKTATGDMKTLAQRRNAALEAFRAFGVVEAQIYAALGVGGVADIGLDQLATLGGFLTSIKDEGRDPEELFPRIETRAKAAPAPPAEPPKQTGSKQNGGAGRAVKPSPPAAPEAASDTAPPTPLENGIVECLLDAHSATDLRQLRAMYELEIGSAPPDVRARVDALFAEAEKKFQGGA